MPLAWWRRRRRPERARARSSSAASPIATRCPSARWCSRPDSGGVYPKGIPVGTVTGVVREQAGWERVYRLRPAANPGSAAHVLILVGTRATDLARAFPSDSALEAMRLDSIARVRGPTLLLRPPEQLAAARRDSLHRQLAHDGWGSDRRHLDRQAPRRRTSSPMMGGAPTANISSGRDSTPMISATGYPGPAAAGDAGAPGSSLLSSGRAWGARGSAPTSCSWR